ncbi:DeoR/GlpR family DNA-binding transcription regulator [Micromonospora sp. DT47]|uniref:DeoR/GlpR family DNA-binding transcription regulator n=1 Tax=Micromonospora sp. DT47 TaxID=3393431 RepID=UPI003CE984F5
METAQRRAGILRLLEQSESITVADLVEQLGVSEATVRRDLVRLDQEGVLRRTHGGARRIALRGVATPFFARSAVNHDAKVRIAAAAADMVTSGESVILDSGTTCLEVARQLRVSDVRVMPLSLRSAAVLGELPDLRLTMCGGDIRPHELSYSGALAVSSIARMRFDTAIMSCCGFSFREGLTSYDAEDAAVKAAAIRYSARAILLCDESKWGRTTFGWAADASQLTTIITDHTPTDAERAEAHQHGVEVITV